jgi:hypothetical protein
MNAAVRACWHCRDPQRSALREVAAGCYCDHLRLLHRAAGQNLKGIAHGNLVLPLLLLLLLLLSGVGRPGVRRRQQPAQAASSPVQRCQHSSRPRSHHARLEDSISLAANLLDVEC